MKHLRNFCKIKKKLIIEKSQKKLLILHLDEMMGYSGINENIKYGKEAKQSQLNFYNRYGFKGFFNAYNIYRNTRNAVPTLLNFDYGVESYNGKKYFSENVNDRYTKWTVSQNRFFENFNEKKILTVKNKALNYCSDIVTTCLRLNSLNLDNDYIKNFNFSSFDYFS